MITKLLICLVVILFFVILLTLGYNSYVNRAFILDFLDGSWVDSGGNLVVIGINDDGMMDLSFGTPVGDGEYEVITDTRDCNVSKVFFAQEYRVDLGDKTKILVVPTEKKIVFYKKDKPIGEFYSVKMPKQ